MHCTGLYAPVCTHKVCWNCMLQCAKVHRNGSAVPSKPCCLARVAEYAPFPAAFGNSATQERIPAACMQGSARKVFDFSKKCTVLVLDRSGDAVTPLLTPWTYEAMLHELIPGGIVDNTVAVRAETGVVRAPLPPFPSLCPGVPPGAVLMNVPSVVLSIVCSRLSKVAIEALSVLLKEVADSRVCVSCRRRGLPWGQRQTSFMHLMPRMTTVQSAARSPPLHAPPLQL